MYKSIIIFCLSITMPLFAQATKIGVVDLQRIAKSSAEFNNFDAKLKSEFKERIEAVQKLEKTMKSAYDKLQKDAATLSQSERTKIERNIQSMQNELQLKGKALQEDTLQRKREIEQALLLKIQKVIDAIADKEKYDLVIRQEVLLSASKAIDITDKVIQQLKSGK